MGLKMLKFVRKFSKALNFSPDVIFNDVAVSIYSGTQAVISGYGRIAEYDNNMIVVVNDGKQLIITGANLELTEMSANELIVDGVIKTVEFENYKR